MSSNFPLKLTSQSLYDQPTPLPFAAFIEPLRPYHDAQTITATHDHVDAFLRCHQCHAVASRCFHERQVCGFCGAIKVAPAEPETSGRYSPPRRRQRPTASSAPTLEAQDRLVVIEDCSRERIDIPLGRKRSSSSRSRSSSASTDVVDENEPAPPQQTIIFVVDGNLSPDELTLLRDQIQAVIAPLDENMLLGLVVVTRVVKIYELGGPPTDLEAHRVLHADVYPGSHSPRADVEIARLEQHEGNNLFHWTPDDDDLAIDHSLDSTYWSPRYVCYKSCIDRLLMALKNIKPSTVSPADSRQPLAIGAALEYATHLSRLSLTNRATVIAFLGGPCTTGPGSVAIPQTDSKFDPIPPEIVRASAGFYSALGTAAAKERTSISVFCVGAAPFGMTLWDLMVSPSNGMLYHVASISETARHLEYAVVNPVGAVSHVVTKLTVSDGLEVTDVLGPVSLLPTPASDALDKTKQRSMRTTVCTAINASPLLSFAVVFRPVAGPTSRPFVYVQLETQYLNDQDEKITQFLTVRIPVTRCMTTYLHSLDLSAQSAILAKQLTLKARDDSVQAAHAMLNQLLASCRRVFASVTMPLDATSPSYPELNTIYALQLHDIPLPVRIIWRNLYILRHGPLFGSSIRNADQQAWFWSMLLQASAQNVAALAYPVLMEVVITNNSVLLKPVALEPSSVSSTKVLILDAFTHVFVWEASAVVRENPSYAAAQQACQEYMATCMENRSFRSQIMHCEEGSPSSRYLLSRLVTMTDERIDNHKPPGSSIKSLLHRVSSLWSASNTKKDLYWV